VSIPSVGPSRPPGRRNGPGSPNIPGVTSPLQIVGSDPGLACDPAPAGTTGTYSDEELTGIFQRSRTVAMVGASPNWVRPSYFVMKYLQRKGYRVIPVNPVAAGQAILGVIAVADLRDITEPVDVVDVFRRPDALPGIVDAAIAIGARVVWMQLGVRNEAAAEVAEAAGLTVVQDRCMKIEYGRLSGELAWSGINGDVITSRRRRTLG
jgi:predicted CoA-binding protein